MDYVAILSEAMTKPVTPERPLGCGRIYVAISDAGHAKGIQKAAKKLGVTFDRKSHYGTRNAI
jgi:hypothetical protein